MFNVLTLNNISEKGLIRFDKEAFNVSDALPQPEAILLRSFKLTPDHATEGLLAVGRAGAGVNNIPVDAYTDRGIVVFNTPGANATAVKELVDSAWRLSSRVQKMDSIEALFARSDLVTLHVPALPETEKMVNATLLAAMKPGSVLLNFARGEIVDTAEIKASITNGQLGQYISDFPVPELVNLPGVLATPHLGASTDEAEDNCAIMAADQLMDFLTNGNIKNSVNFPNLHLERSQLGCRIALSNRNVPRILGRVLSELADRNINVIDMINKSRNEIAYNLIDIESGPSEELQKALSAIDDVINVRLLA